MQEFSVKEISQILSCILKNAFPTKADFGNLSYAQDDLAEITMTLRPQYCILCY